MRPIARHGVGLCALLLCALPVRAEERPPELPITLEASRLSLDVPSDSYQAQGKVRMVRDGVSLLADNVTYHRLTEEAEAVGGVVLEKEGDLIHGDRLSLNLATEQGELLNGALFIKKTNMRIWSRRLEKSGPREYHLERGSFTTCNGPRPSWHFTARDIDVTLDQYATARDAVFYLRDVPVLYTPYLLFPVKRERQSGLLIPKAGHSTKKGYYFYQPYYWAIDPSQDATFALDLQSGRGVGSEVEYRYMRARGSEGRMQAYGIYDLYRDRFRGELNQNHLEIFSEETTFASDIHVATDRGYYREFGDLNGDYNRQLSESTLAVDHKWERYDATGVLRYVQDLTAPDNTRTLQRLPAIRFVGVGEKVGPLFFSFDAQAVNFERRVGVSGQRLELHPRVTGYFRPVDSLDLSVYGGYQERLYDTYGSSVGQGVQAPGFAQKGDGVRAFGQADAGGALSYPLERVYRGLLRHRIVPTLSYRYVQDRRQVPYFDYDDWVLPQSTLSWSLVNLLTRKRYLESGQPEYRDLLYLRLSQGYQFSGERRDLLTLVDRRHHLTDLLVEARAFPLADLSVGVEGRLNPVDGELSSAGVSAQAKGGAGNEGSLGYRYSRRDATAAFGQLAGVNYLEGQFTAPLIKPLYASVLARYSLERSVFLESRYALEYRHQCWSLVLSYSERLGNRDVMANFNLSGVGARGGMKLF